MRGLDSITDSTDMNLRKRQCRTEEPGGLQFMGSQRVRYDSTRE